MEDKNNYQFYGHYKYSAKILKNQLGNAMQGGYDGPNYIKFNDGSIVSYKSPTLLIKGLLYGTRSLDLIGNFIIYDNANDLQCSIKFYDGGGLFSKKLHKTDYFEGSISKISSPNQSLCKIEGSWLEYINFDGITYWDLQKIKPLKLIQKEIPLPSDCRYREDLIYLAQKNLELAQEWKIKLEVIQRADRKFRAEKGPQLKQHK